MKIWYHKLTRPNKPFNVKFHLKTDQKSFFRKNVTISKFFTTKFSYQLENWFENRSHRIERITRSIVYLNQIINDWPTMTTTKINANLGSDKQPSQKLDNPIYPPEYSVDMLCSGSIKIISIKEIMFSVKKILIDSRWRSTFGIK